MLSHKKHFLLNRDKKVVFFSQKQTKCFQVKNKQNFMFPKLLNIYSLSR